MVLATVLLATGCGSGTYDPSAYLPADGGTNSCGTDTWGNYAQGFFANNCAGCHSQFSSYSTASGQADSIGSQIASGSMPRGGGLSSSDQNRILAWIACGTPQ